MRTNFLGFLLATSLTSSRAFSTSSITLGRSETGIRTSAGIDFFLSNAADDWNGEVVSNTADGRIQGCSITRVEGTISEWEISIDGQQADLGKFSEAIYKKICADVKQQRFQGFRPGTIPPHLVPTYIGFAMDECAREATLEALQQNNIRPFEDARESLEFSSISMLPPKKKKKKSKKKRKKSAPQGDSESTVTPEPEVVSWLTFDTMKEAISAGWKPGQAFSFVATNVKGQQLQDQDVSGASAIGGSSIL